MRFIFNCNDLLLQEWSQNLVQQKSEKLLVYSWSKNCFQQNKSRLVQIPTVPPLCREPNSSRTDELQHNNCLWYKTDVCTSWRNSSFHRDKTTIILLTINKSEKQTHNLHIPGSCWKLTKQTGVLKRERYRLGRDARPHCAKTKLFFWFVFSLKPPLNVQKSPENACDLNSLLHLRTVPKTQ